MQPSGSQPKVAPRVRRRPNDVRAPAPTSTPSQNASTQAMPSSGSAIQHTSQTTDQSPPMSTTGNPSLPHLMSVALQTGTESGTNPGASAVSSSAPGNELLSGSLRGVGGGGRPMSSSGDFPSSSSLGAFGGSLGATASQINQTQSSTDSVLQQSLAEAVKSMTMVTAYEAQHRRPFAPLTFHRHRDPLDDCPTIVTNKAANRPLRGGGSANSYTQSLLEGNFVLNPKDHNLLLPFQAHILRLLTEESKRRREDVDLSNVLHHLKDLLTKCHSELVEECSVMAQVYPVTSLEGGGGTLSSTNTSNASPSPTSLLSPPLERAIESCVANQEHAMAVVNARTRLALMLDAIIFTSESSRHVLIGPNKDVVQPPTLLEFTDNPSQQTAPAQAQLGSLVPLYRQLLPLWAPSDSLAPLDSWPALCSSGAHLEATWVKIKDAHRSKTSNPEATGADSDVLLSPKSTRPLMAKNAAKAMLKELLPITLHAVGEVLGECNRALYTIRGLPPPVASSGNKGHLSTNTDNCFVQGVSEVFVEVVDSSSSTAHILSVAAEDYCSFLEQEQERASARATTPVKDPSEALSPRPTVATPVVADRPHFPVDSSAAAPTVRPTVRARPAVGKRPQPGDSKDSVTSKLSSDVGVRTPTVDEPVAAASNIPTRQSQLQPSEVPKASSRTAPTNTEVSYLPGCGWICKALVHVPLPLSQALCIGESTFSKVLVDVGEVHAGRTPLEYLASLVEGCINEGVSRAVKGRNAAPPGGRTIVLSNQDATLLQTTFSLTALQECSKSSGPFEVGGNAASFQRAATDALPSPTSNAVGYGRLFSSNTITVTPSDPSTTPTGVNAVASMPAESLLSGENASPSSSNSRVITAAVEAFGRCVASIGGGQLSTRLNEVGASNATIHNSTAGRAAVPNAPAKGGMHRAASSSALTSSTALSSTTISAILPTVQPTPTASLTLEDGHGGKVVLSILPPQTRAGNNTAAPAPYPTHTVTAFTVSEPDKPEMLSTSTSHSLTISTHAPSSLQVPHSATSHASSTQFPHATKGRLLGPTLPYSFESNPMIAAPSLAATALMVPPPPQNSNTSASLSVSWDLFHGTPLIASLIKAKSCARVLTSHEFVVDNYGVTHIELSFGGSYISRSDMHMVTNYVEGRVFFVGEEFKVDGLTFMVTDMKRPKDSDALEMFKQRENVFKSSLCPNVDMVAHLIDAWGLKAPATNTAPAPPFGGGGNKANATLGAFHQLLDEVWSSSDDEADNGRSTPPFVTSDVTCLYHSDDDRSTAKVSPTPNHLTRSEKRRALEILEDIEAGYISPKAVICPKLYTYLMQKADARKEARLHGGTHSGITTPGVRDSSLQLWSDRGSTTGGSPAATMSTSHRRQHSIATLDLESPRPPAHGHSSLPSVQVTPIRPTTSNNNNNNKTVAISCVRDRLRQTFMPRARLSKLQSPVAADAPHLAPSLFKSVKCGLVSPNTIVCYSSTTFVENILIELSEEMWSPTVDGRTNLDWALNCFLKEHVARLRAAGSAPRVRLVFFGTPKSTDVVSKEHLLSPLPAHFTHQKSNSVQQQAADASVGVFFTVWFSTSVPPDYEDDPTFYLNYKPDPKKDGAPAKTASTKDDDSFSESDDEERQVGGSLKGSPKMNSAAGNWRSSEDILESIPDVANEVCRRVLQKLQQVREQAEVTAALSTREGSVGGPSPTSSPLSLVGQHNAPDSAAMASSLFPSSPLLVDAHNIKPTGLAFGEGGQAVDGTFFTCAKEAHVLEAINLCLNGYDRHHVDRDMTHTGQTITVLSAGKGLYSVRRRLALMTATRFLDIGVQSCRFVCMGRPPLHLTPLLEYSGSDLRQVNAQTEQFLSVPSTVPSSNHRRRVSRDHDDGDIGDTSGHSVQSFSGASVEGESRVALNANCHYYEQPQWAISLFYHPTLQPTPLEVAATEDPGRAAGKEPREKELPISGLSSLRRFVVSSPLVHKASANHDAAAPTTATSRAHGGASVVPPGGSAVAPPATAAESSGFSLFTKSVWDAQLNLSRTQVAILTQLFDAQASFDSNPCRRGSLQSYPSFEPIKLFSTYTAATPIQPSIPPPSRRTGNQQRSLGGPHHHHQQQQADGLLQQYHMATPVAQVNRSFPTRAGVGRSNAGSFVHKPSSADRLLFEQLQANTVYSLVTLQRLRQFRDATRISLRAGLQLPPCTTRRCLSRAMEDILERTRQLPFVGSQSRRHHTSNIHRYCRPAELRELELTEASSAVSISSARNESVSDGGAAHAGAAIEPFALTCNVASAVARPPTPSVVYASLMPLFTKGSLCQYTSLEIVANAIPALLKGAGSESPETQPSQWEPTLPRKGDSSLSPSAGFSTPGLGGPRLSSLVLNPKLATILASLRLGVPLVGGILLSSSSRACQSSFPVAAASSNPPRQVVEVPISSIALQEYADQPREEAHLSEASNDTSSRLAEDLLVIEVEVVAEWKKVVRGTSQSKYLSWEKGAPLLSYTNEQLGNATAFPNKAPSVEAPSPAMPSLASTVVGPSDAFLGDTSMPVQSALTAGNLSGKGSVGGSSNRRAGIPPPPLGFTPPYQGGAPNARRQMSGADFLLPTRFASNDFAPSSDVVPPLSYIPIGSTLRERDIVGADFGLNPRNTLLNNDSPNNRRASLRSSLFHSEAVFHDPSDGGDTEGGQPLCMCLELTLKTTVLHRPHRGGGPSPAARPRRTSSQGRNTSLSAEESDSPPQAVAPSQHPDVPTYPTTVRPPFGLLPPVGTHPPDTSSSSPAAVEVLCEVEWRPDLLTNPRLWNRLLASFNSSLFGGQDMAVREEASDDPLAHPKEPTANYARELEVAIAHSDIAGLSVMKADRARGFQLRAPQADGDVSSEPGVSSSLLSHLPQLFPFPAASSKGSSLSTLVSSKHPTAPKPEDDLNSCTNYDNTRRGSVEDALLEGTDLPSTYIRIQSHDGLYASALREYAAAPLSQWVPESNVKTSSPSSMLPAHELLPGGQCVRLYANPDVPNYRAVLPPEKVWFLLTDELLDVKVYSTVTEGEEAAGASASIVELQAGGIGSDDSTGAASNDAPTSGGSSSGSRQNATAGVLSAARRPVTAVLVSPRNAFVGSVRPKLSTLFPFQPIQPYTYASPDDGGDAARLSRSDPLLSQDAGVTNRVASVLSQLANVGRIRSKVFDYRRQWRGGEEAARGSHHLSSSPGSNEDVFATYLKTAAASANFDNPLLLLYTTALGKRVEMEVNATEAICRSERRKCRVLGYITHRLVKLHRSEARSHRRQARSSRKDSRLISKIPKGDNGDPPPNPSRSSNSSSPDDASPPPFLMGSTRQDPTCQNNEMQQANDGYSFPKGDASYRGESGESGRALGYFTVAGQNLNLTDCTPSSSHPTMTPPTGSQAPLFTDQSASESRVQIDDVGPYAAEAVSAAQQGYGTAIRTASKQRHMSNVEKYNHDRNDLLRHMYLSMLSTGCIFYLRWGYSHPKQIAVRGDVTVPTFKAVLTTSHTPDGDAMRRHFGRYPFTVHNQTFGDLKRMCNLLWEPFARCALMPVFQFNPLETSILTDVGAAPIRGPWGTITEPTDEGIGAMERLHVLLAAIVGSSQPLGAITSPLSREGGVSYQGTQERHIRKSNSRMRLAAFDPHASIGADSITNDIIVDRYVDSTANVSSSAVSADGSVRDRCLPSTRAPFPLDLAKLFSHQALRLLDTFYQDVPNAVDARDDPAVSSDPSVMFTHKCHCISVDGVMRAYTRTETLQHWYFEAIRRRMAGVETAASMAAALNVRRKAALAKLEALVEEEWGRLQAARQKQQQQHDDNNNNENESCCVKGESETPPTEESAAFPAKLTAEEALKELVAESILDEEWWFVGPLLDKGGSNDPRSRAADATWIRNVRTNALRLSREEHDLLLLDVEPSVVEAIDEDPQGAIRFVSSYSHDVLSRLQVLVREAVLQRLHRGFQVVSIRQDGLEAVLTLNHQVHHISLEIRSVDTSCGNAECGGTAIERLSAEVVGREDLDLIHAARYESSSPLRSQFGSDPIQPQKHSLFLVVRKKFHRDVYETPAEQRVCASFHLHNTHTGCFDRLKTEFVSSVGGAGSVLHPLLASSFSLSEHQWYVVDHAIINDTEQPFETRLMFMNDRAAAVAKSIMMQPSMHGSPTTPHQKFAPQLVIPTGGRRLVSDVSTPELLPILAVLNDTVTSDLLQRAISSTSLGGTLRTRSTQPGPPNGVEVNETVGCLLSAASTVLSQRNRSRDPNGNSAIKHAIATAVLQHRTIRFALIPKNPTWLRGNSRHAKARSLFDHVRTVSKDVVALVGDDRFTMPSSSQDNVEATISMITGVLLTYIQQLCSDEPSSSAARTQHFRVPPCKTPIDGYSSFHSLLASKLLLPHDQETLPPQPNAYISNSSTPDAPAAVRFRSHVSHSTFDNFIRSKFSKRFIPQYTQLDDCTCAGLWRSDDRELSTINASELLPLQRERATLLTEVASFLRLNAFDGLQAISGSETDHTFGSVSESTNPTTGNSLTMREEVHVGSLSHVSGTAQSSDSFRSPQKSNCSSNRPASPSLGTAAIASNDPPSTGSEGKTNPTSPSASLLWLTSRPAVFADSQQQLEFALAGTLGARLLKDVIKHPDLLLSGDQHHRMDTLPAAGEEIRGLRSISSAATSLMCAVDTLSSMASLAEGGHITSRSHLGCKPLHEERLTRINMLQDNAYAFSEHVVDANSGLRQYNTLPRRTRYMSASIHLTPQYNPRCFFMLEARWLLCSGSLIGEWVRALVSFAHRDGLETIPIPASLNGRMEADVAPAEEPAKGGGWMQSPKVNDLRSATSDKRDARATGEVTIGTPQTTRGVEDVVGDLAVYCTLTYFPPTHLHFKVMVQVLCCEAVLYSAPIHQQLQSSLHQNTAANRSVTPVLPTPPSISSATNDPDSEPRADDSGDVNSNSRTSTIPLQQASSTAEVEENSPRPDEIQGSPLSSEMLLAAALKRVRRVLKTRHRLHHRYRPSIAVVDRPCRLLHTSGVFIVGVDVWSDESPMVPMVSNSPLSLSPLGNDKVPFNPPEGDSFPIDHAPQSRIRMVWSPNPLLAIPPERVSEERRHWDNSIAMTDAITSVLVDIFEKVYANI